MKKAEELIEENPDIEPVLEHILDVQDKNGGIEWNDIKDKASSGQWGRLIQEGILVDSGDSGFVVKDEGSLKKALGREDEQIQDSDKKDIDTSWSTLDKLVAFLGGFLVLFGYSNPTARNGIAKIVDVFLSPLLFLDLPYYQVILVLALITGLYSSYLQLYLIDWGWLRKRQEKIKGVQKDLRGKNPDELGSEQKEVMSQQFDIMKVQFKPTIWIMVLTIPIFIWLYWSFGGMGASPHLDAIPKVVFPFAGSVEFNESVISLPFGRAWLLWYIICSISLGQVARKTLGVNMT